MVSIALGWFPVYRFRNCLWTDPYVHNYTTVYMYIDMLFHFRMKLVKRNRDGALRQWRAQQDEQEHSGMKPKLITT